MKKKKKKRHWYWWSPMFADWIKGKPKYHVAGGLRFAARKPRLDDPPKYYKRVSEPPAK